MKTLFLSISDDSSEARIMPSYCINVENTNVLVKKLIKDIQQTFFLQIKHQHINTLLDLTDCTPYELWYFDDKEKYTGKSFSLQKEGAPFLIQSQARFIALVPVGIKYTRIQKRRNQKGETNFTLSKTFLPTSEPYANEIAVWTLSLFGASNEELIQTLNNEIEKKSWVAARGFYLDCLKTEIRNRPFNSDILFDFDTTGNFVAFKVANKVTLLNNTLQLI